MSIGNFKPTNRLFIVMPLLALFAVTLYFIVITSSSVRYWADDFCSATTLRNHGYWGAQILWWKSWTGRYSYIAALDFFELLGPWAVRIIPLLLLVLLTLSILPVLFFDAVLSYLFIILTLINAPNIIQSFYWQTGSLNYVIPFVFLNLFLSLVVWAKRKIPLLVASLLLFIAGGFSESYALAQLVLVTFVLLMIITLDVPAKSQRIKVVAAGIFGALLSLFVMYLSPGNLARSTTVTHPESLAYVVSSTIYGTKWYLERLLLIKPFLYSLIIGASVIFFFVSRNWKLFKKVTLSVRRMVLTMLLAVLAAVVATAAVIGSGYYSMAITPPERTMFIVVYIVFICFFIFCFIASVLVKRLLSKKTERWLRLLVTLFFLLASIFLIESTFFHWQEVESQLKNYAKDWDVQEKVLIKAKSGSSPVSIKNIKPVGELDGFTDNKGWVTSCVSGYYQVKNIKIEE